MNNLNILQEITERLSNETLESISHTYLWNSIKSFSEDQLWWYHRTEFLVGRELKPQRGDWARVYKSLSESLLEDDLSFEVIQDYGSPLLISVIFELGVDPTHSSGTIMYGASRYWNLEVFKLLLSDPRIDPSVDNNRALIESCSRGSVEIVKLLLSDPRVDPTARHGECLHIAVEQQWSEIVRILLLDVRVNPSSRQNQAILIAVTHGDTETVALLLSDKRVDPSHNRNRATEVAIDYGYTEIVRLLLADVRVARSYHLDGMLLKRIVASNRVEILGLLLSYPREVEASSTSAEDDEEYDEAFVMACMFGHLKIIELLLSSGSVTDPSFKRNYPLRIARKHGRRDVEELLLTYPEVKEKDESS